MAGEYCISLAPKGLSKMRLGRWMGVDGENIAPRCRRGQGPAPKPGRRRAARAERSQMEDVKCEERPADLGLRSSDIVFPPRVDKPHSLV